MYSTLICEAFPFQNACGLTNFNQNIFHVIPWCVTTNLPRAWVQNSTELSVCVHVLVFLVVNLQFPYTYIVRVCPKISLALLLFYLNIHKLDPKKMTETLVQATKH